MKKLMIITAIVISGLLLGHGVSGINAASEPKNEVKIDSSVFGVIGEAALKSQFVLFGISYHAKKPARILSERTLIKSLMPYMAANGYKDMVILIYEEFQNVLDRYLKGEISEQEAAINTPYLYRVAGIDILKLAKRLNMRVWAFDPTYDLGPGGTVGSIMSGEMDKKIFNSIQKKILAKNPGAKTLIILAENYISEQPTFSPKPLGMWLEEFKKDKSFSINLEGKEYPNHAIKTDLKIRIEIKDSDKTAPKK